VTFISILVPIWGWRREEEEEEEGEEEGEGGREGRRAGIFGIMSLSGCKS